MRKVGGPVVCRNPGLALANTSNLEPLPFSSVVMSGMKIGLPSNSRTVLEPVQTSPPGPLMLNRRQQMPSQRRICSDVYAAPKLKRSVIVSHHSHRLMTSAYACVRKRRDERGSFQSAPSKSKAQNANGLSPVTNKPTFLYACPRGAGIWNGTTRNATRSASLSD